MAINKIIIGSNRQSRLAAGVEENNFVRVQDLNSVIEETNAELDALSSGSSGPLVYKALITQTGTNAPTAIVLENTLGQTPTYAYDGVGNYYLELGTPVDVNKTFVTFTQTQPNDRNDMSSLIEVFDNTTTTQIYFASYRNTAGTFSFQDAIITATPICIEVYP